MPNTTAELEAHYGAPNERSQLPSAGEMLRRVNAEQYGETFDVERYEAELAERVKKSLY